MRAGSGGKAIFAVGVGNGVEQFEPGFRPFVAEAIDAVTVLGPVGTGTIQKFKDARFATSSA